MGKVIARQAAVEDIVGDCDKTLANATARGGIWKDLAEERLAPVLTLFHSVDAQLEDAKKELTPLLATLEVKNDEADALLGKWADEIWNLVGRPAADPALSVLFPGGIAYYAEGDTDGQPDRMDVLAQLLLGGIHPKLPKDKAATASTEVTAAADALRVAVDAVRKPAAKVGALGRIRTAVGRVAHIELANLKRLYKGRGFSEVDIHAVIPDRPKASKAAPKAPAGDGAAPPAGGTPA